MLFKRMDLQPTQCAFPHHKSFDALYSHTFEINLSITWENYVYRHLS